MSNPFVDAWNYATRNTDTYVSGTGVTREEAANWGETMGYDSEEFAGVDEYNGGDVETSYPEWREEGQEWTEENTPDNPVDEAVKWAKILTVTAVSVVGLYLLRPIFAIAAGVLGE